MTKFQCDDEKRYNICSIIILYMAKFVVTIETDDEGASPDEVADKINSRINEYNINSGSVTRVQPHAIYSETDVPSKVYWKFDGYEDLEFAHLEKQRSDFADNVISEPLHNDWLHCTCGEINNVSPEEAIEHLEEVLPTGVHSADIKIDKTKIDDQTVVRSGETGKTRRKTEVVHFVQQKNETVTFLHVRGDSEERAVKQAHERVMFADEWETAEVVHHEGDEIYVVRLAHSGHPDDLDVAEIGSVDISPESMVKNKLTDEFISFVSTSASSPDDALDNISNVLVGGIGGNVSKEVVYQEDNVYVVRC